MMIKKILITEQMKLAAITEAKRRAPHINHHFEVGHMSGEERDIIGFLGEFACCELFNIDWRKNIRKDYITIDEFDLKINNKKIDVKTETLPLKFFNLILNGEIDDNKLYGRRLINEGQSILLTKYDLVVFGAFKRDDLSYWYPIGYLDTETILKDYKPTRIRPDGGNYPFSALPVHNSILKHINLLL
jgi:hypothetical protein